MTKGDRPYILISQPQEREKGLTLTHVSQIVRNVSEGVSGARDSRDRKGEAYLGT